MKGTYSHTEGGFIQSGLRALVNAPVFTYYTADQKDSRETWKLLRDAENRGYLITAGTDGVSDQTVNSCGITNAHAFSILKVFEITD